MFDPWTLSLASLVLYNLFDAYLNHRQATKLKDLTIPAAAKNFEHLWKIDPEEYRNNKKYSSEKMALNSMKSLVTLSVEVIFYYFGPFRFLDALSRSVTDYLIVRILVFLSIKQLLDLIFSMPFSYRAQFDIEQRYGFNKMTVALFIKDAIISFALELIISAAILTGVVKIIELTGPMMPVYMSCFLTFCILALMLIWPNYIAPLFNKFESLGSQGDEKEVDLRKRVEDISGRAKFPIAEIYKMDGSKRSAHSQAYFFGIFKKKRIVIYDTLINDLENRQTEAVLCHEIGHWFHSHNVQMLGASLLSLQLIVYVISRFVFDKSFYASFGFDQIDYFVGVSLSLLMFSMVSGVIGFLMVKLSRRNEFQADEFALKYEHGDNLVEALVLIYKKNKADVDPDWLYSSLKHTHPTLIQRIDNISAHMKRK